MTRRYVLVLVGALGFLLTGCIEAGEAVATVVAALPTAAVTPVPAIEPAPRLVALGREIYRAQYCGACHTATAADTRGMFGPGHDAMGLIAEERVQSADYAGEAETAADYIRESIVSPKAYLVQGYQATHHPMPDFSFLSQEDLEALVHFLLAQRDPAALP